MPLRGAEIEGLVQGTMARGAAISDGAAEGGQSQATQRAARQPVDPERCSAGQGCPPCALTFRYGQRHEAEIDCARRIATQFQVARYVVVDIDLRRFGGSALTSAIDVPKGRSLDDMSRGIPITYVPARNTIFLSFALAW